MSGLIKFTLASAWLVKKWCMYLLDTHFFSQGVNVTDYSWATLEDHQQHFHYGNNPLKRGFYIYFEFECFRNILVEICLYYHPLPSHIMYFLSLGILFC